ncbi:MAG: manganese efflux pump [Bacteroidales bacterium]|nr:manganese efflux pump [Bacteroidales bacterium]
MNLHTLILFSVGFAMAFIALGIGANAAFKTKERITLYQMQFALFMAVFNFCFYYIGIWASRLLMDLLSIRYIIVAMIMFILCIKTILNHYQYKAEDNYYNLNRLPIKIVLAAAAGINSFLCGIALTLGNYEHLKSALLSSVLVFIGSLLGAGLPPKKALIVSKWHPAFIGSFLFLAIGIIFVLKHFGKISFYY